jgi:hypothetical protein
MPATSAQNSTTLRQSEANPVPKEILEVETTVLLRNDCFEELVAPGLEKSHLPRLIPVPEVSHHN